ncbi:MAG: sulfite exporter TauE/SafE family protein, partial [Myxococcaceae bacterium]
MTPLEFSAVVFSTSLGAGVLGSMLGIGGGILLVPFLTLGMGVEMRYAVGASIISVIATSSGAAAAYVRDRLTNLRLAMFLEVATTAGALTGAIVAGHLQSRWLYFIFGGVLAWSALAMIQRLRHGTGPALPSDAWADRLRLHGSYTDEAGERVEYQVKRPWHGLGLMYIAGTVSGLLGIGSGALKVPAMDLAMRVPLKVSTATSNFMIGVTAAASAGVYFARGDIDPFIAGPVCAGVVIGSIIGARHLRKVRNSSLRLMFVVLLLYVAFQM